MVVGCDAIERAYLVDISQKWKQCKSNHDLGEKKEASKELQSRNCFDSNWLEFREKWRSDSIWMNILRNSVLRANANRHKIHFVYFINKNNLQLQLGMSCYLNSTNNNIAALKVICNEELFDLVSAAHILVVWIFGLETNENAHITESHFNLAQMMSINAKRNHSWGWALEIRNKTYSHMNPTHKHSEGIWRCLLFHMKTEWMRIFAQPGEYPPQNQMLLPSVGRRIRRISKYHMSNTYLNSFRRVWFSFQLRIFSFSILSFSYTTDHLHLMAFYSIENGCAKLLISFFRMSFNALQNTITLLMHYIHFPFIWLYYQLFSTLSENNKATCTHGISGQCGNTDQQNPLEYISVCVCVCASLLRESAELIIGFCILISMHVAVSEQPDTYRERCMMLNSILQLKRIFNSNGKLIIRFRL